MNSLRLFIGVQPLIISKLPMPAMRFRHATSNHAADAAALEPNHYTIGKLRRNMNEEGRKLNMVTQIVVILALFLSISLASAQEKIVIGGSGSLNEELVDLAKAYMAKYPAESVEIRPEPMSTEGGLEGVRSGRFQIGLVARPLNPTEKSKLVYITVARSIAGVVIHKSMPISNLSDSQVCDVFSGKIKSWKEIGGNDGKIVVLTRKRDDSNTEAFRNRMPCFK